MKKVSIVLLALCAVSTLGIELDTSEDVGDDEQQIGDGETRIIGGIAAVSGQFPWQVSIYTDFKQLCGGSIISDRWVLTAGHCLTKATSLKVMFGLLSPFCVAPGCNNMQTTTTFYLHEQYKSRNDPVTPRYVPENDIGLVQLPQPLPAWTTTISMVRLPKRSHQSMLFVGQQAVASGWGYYTFPNTGISMSLLYANMDVISNTACEADWRGLFPVLPTVICTDKARATYSGDSGGPLVWMDVDGLNYQIGVVSFGRSDEGATAKPSGFTRVSSYLDWISAKTGIAIEA